jgi:hypothetical protein
VVDGPHEPHEIEHGPERTVAGSFWIGLGRSCLRRAGQAITVTPEDTGRRWYSRRASGAPGVHARMD